jgi:flagellar FliL protein
MADDVVAEGAPAEGAEEPTKGLIGKLLGNKKMLIIGGAALLLLLGGGGAAYYFFFAGSDAPPPGGQTAEADNTPIVPPTVAFYDVPDIIVNIQTVDGTPAYLKLGISLELANDAQKAGLQVVMPRVVDQFQGYLRELRMDDLKGSAGVLRLKEELLRRINVAASPYRIRDVLLKEMIVQ